MGAACYPIPWLGAICSSFYQDTWLFSGNSLPALGGDPSTITLSGISGGSFTATQLHTIYSETIKGAGLMIGGPYGQRRMSKENNAQQSIDLATQFAAEGLIDSTSNF